MEESRSRASRLGRDAAVPGLLLLVGTMELATFGRQGWQPSIAVEAVASVLLVFRRYHLIVPVLALVPPFFIPLLGPEMNDVAAPLLYIVVSMFAVGRWYPRRTSVMGVSVGLLFLVYAIATHEGLLDPTDAMFVLSVAVPPYVFGRVVRRMAEQKEQIEAQQRELARQAVIEERGRIARELHDVIAHSISAMVVQAAAAQDAVRSDLGQAERLLANVADTGRAALTETGRLLHVVRDDADELGLAPAPGLADLPALVASFRERGLEVEAEITVGTEPVPAGVDVSAYRIVQESLTNAFKHGDRSRGPVRLRVADAPDLLEIRCSSPSSLDGEARAPGSGLGLAGMAERVSVLQGRLRHGLVGDRFEVAAQLPLGEGGVR